MRLLFRVARPFTKAFGRRSFGTGRGKGGGALEAYGNLLEKHPLVTKVVTSAVIVGTGDLM